MSFTKILSQGLKAYFANLQLISFFSIPFLVAFPLALQLPNFVALSGIYLRLGSLGSDVSALALAVMLAELLASLLLFSFAVVAVNSVLRAQRVMNKLKYADFERMEEATFKLFAVFVGVFIASFIVNLVLYQSSVSEGVRIVLNSLFSLALALAVLFVPQAIVIDNSSVENSVMLSMSILRKKPWYAVFLVALAGALLALNTWAFAGVGGPWGSWLSIAFNALVFLPFLEVLKVQIYLSKYTLLD